MLSVFGAVSDDICVEQVGTEPYVGVARPGHPIGKKPSLDKFCRYPQVIVSAVGALSSTFDLQLQEHGVQRQVTLSISSFLSVPAIVANSDTLALIPRSVAMHWPAAAYSGDRERRNR